MPKSGHKFGVKVNQIFLNGGEISTDVLPKQNTALTAG
jgi:hypothetical protein